MAGYQSSILTTESFSSLYNEYYVVLVKYTYTIVQDKEQAKDIVADLFCELWNARHKLNIHTNLKNYLLVSARRMANKQLSKSTVGEDLLLADHAWEESSYKKLLHKESHQLLNELLNNLPQEKLDIVQLRLIGLTYNEIAEVLHITPKKVEYQLTTAISMLHEEVKSKPHLKELSFLLLLHGIIHQVTIS